MTMRKSHTTAVLASRAHLLYRINGQSDGLPYWSYALIDEAKLAAFKKALATGRIHVQDFGKVLVWGEGAEPPPHVVQELKDKYDYEVIA